MYGHIREGLFMFAVDALQCRIYLYTHTLVITCLALHTDPYLSNSSECYF
jgi:hypothetical protein